MKDTSPLLTVLQRQISPWIQQHGAAHVVVAYPTLRETLQQELPAGVKCSPKPLLSKPIAVKGKKLYEGDAAEVDTHWPKDRMYARRVPALAVICRGYVALPYGDYYLHCPPGYFIAMPPGTPHSDGSYLGLDEEMERTGHRESVNFMVRGNGVECWLTKVKNYQYVRPEHGEQYYSSAPGLRLYLENLVEEMVACKPFSQELATAMLQALIATMSRNIMSGSALHSELPQVHLDHQTDTESQLIARAEEYLRHHLSEELTIDKVARAMYVSRSYFTRKFRQYTGKTFIDYVNDCRLNEAKILLQETEWPIAKIGESIGLKPSRLREIFQEREGISPQEYREQLLK